MEKRILNELVKYSKRMKAEVVHRKLLKAGKTKMARKIALRYGLNTYDDTTMAFGLALNSEKLK